jgi:hypothetical protein
VRERRQLSEGYTLKHALSICEDPRRVGQVGLIQKKRGELSVREGKRRYRVKHALYTREDPSRVGQVGMVKQDGGRGSGKLCVDEWRGRRNLIVRSGAGEEA